MYKWLLLLAQSATIQIAVISLFQDKIGSLEGTLSSLEKKIKSYKEENSELKTKLSSVNAEASNL